MKGKPSPTKGKKGLMSEKGKKSISNATKKRLANPENHPMYGKNIVLKRDKKYLKKSNKLMLKDFNLGIKIGKMFTQKNNQKEFPKPQKMQWHVKK